MTSKEPDGGLRLQRPRRDRLPKKDYPKALRYFTDGAEKIAAAQKLKEISLGRAKTLLALGKLDEAQKAFEQVASVREWRGEATACSVYSLGQIAAKRGKWAEANCLFPARLRRLPEVPALGRKSLYRERREFRKARQNPGSDQHLSRAPAQRKAGRFHRSRRSPKAPGGSGTRMMTISNHASTSSSSAFSSLGSSSYRLIGPGPKHPSQNRPDDRNQGRPPFRRHGDDQSAGRREQRRKSVTGPRRSPRSLSPSRPN